MEQAITLAPVLPASIEITPDSVYLTASEQVVGTQIEVEATVRDSLGALMQDIPVMMDCSLTEGEDATMVVPVAPSTRISDAQGRAQLLAAITHVGRSGLSTPVPCTLSSGPASTTLVVSGQSFEIFSGGFED